MLTTCQTIYAEAKSILSERNKVRVLVRTKEFENGKVVYRDDLAGICEDPASYTTPLRFNCLDYVRNLLLDIELRLEHKTDRRRQRIWLREVLAQVAAAPAIKKLHLYFKPKFYKEFRIEMQNEFDAVIRTLGEARCEGIITAHMDFMLGRMGLNAMSYYDMLASNGG